MTISTDGLTKDAAVALLALHGCSEFSAFGSGEMAVRLLPDKTGANGWCEITGEHLDSLVERELLAWLGDDGVTVTAKGTGFLIQRGWVNDEGGIEENGRYWLKRAVRADDRKAFGPLLASYKASYVAMAVFSGRVR